MILFTIEKATKKKSKLRIAVSGPPGAGKTYSLIEIAGEMAEPRVDGKGGVVVIDTERGSASLYADKFEFDVLELPSFEPQTYIAAIQHCEKLDYDVIVIDSISHGWSGTGGALEQKAKVDERPGSNSYTSWSKITPIQNKFVEAMLNSKCHMLVSMRAKTAYILETNSQGKQAPRKVGLAPIQREGIEHEFTVYGEMSADHSMYISKSRFSDIDKQEIPYPFKGLARQLMNWLNDGVEAPIKPTAGFSSTPQGDAQCTTQAYNEAVKHAAGLDWPSKQFQDLCFREFNSRTKLTNDQLRIALDHVEAFLPMDVVR